MHKLRNDITAITFGLLILSMLPAIIVGSSSTPAALAQPIPPPITNNQNTTDIQPGGGEEPRLPTQDGFTIRVLASNFSAPHNILYGPDGALWITERIGKNITRVDPNNGSRLSTMPVPDVYQSAGQDGLLGMAFDPDFNNTHYIYVAYTYANETGDDVDRRTKITRFTYNPEGQSIGNPKDIISGLAASVDHNSGRMTFGPDGKLYYTIGDQGNNQFTRYCFDIRAQALPTAEQVAAQDWSVYQGKVLRMNPDGSIPEDNPEINGVRSHIFTYGHRNAQGIAVGPDDDLYVVEHGPNSDDEFNHLQAGRNFGWPYIAGFQDDQAYRYINWSGAANCEDLSWTQTGPPPEGVPMMNESEFQAENLVEPVATFYTVETGYDFTNPACGEFTSVCFPTAAPSSLRLYTSDEIPEWNSTFLMTTLKSGRIFHLVLNEDGTALASEPEELFRSENRYRDLAFGPDGRTIYVITDSFGNAQNIEGGATIDLWTPGSLIEFRYEGGGESNGSAGQ
jgi:PQQ-dependent dehydrogenase (s-GDH family)